MKYIILFLTLWTLSAKGQSKTDTLTKGSKDSSPLKWNPQFHSKIDIWAPQKNSFKDFIKQRIPDSLSKVSDDIKVKFSIDSNGNISNVISIVPKNNQLESITLKAVKEFKWINLLIGNKHQNLSYYIAVKYPDGILSMLYCGDDITQDDLYLRTYTYNCKKDSLQKFIKEKYELTDLSHDSSINQGGVSLDVDINPDGKVGKIKIWESSDQKLSSFLPEIIRQYLNWPMSEKAIQLSFSVSFPDISVLNFNAAYENGNIVHMYIPNGNTKK